jgi:hypothetical protein
MISHLGQGFRPMCFRVLLDDPISPCLRLSVNDAPDQQRLCFVIDSTISHLGQGFRPICFRVILDPISPCLRLSVYEASDHSAFALPGTA